MLGGEIDIYVFLYIDIYTHTYIYTYMADSFCCTGETNTTLKSNYTTIRINLSKKNPVFSKHS